MTGIFLKILPIPGTYVYENHQKWHFFRTPPNWLFSFDIRPYWKPPVLGAEPSRVFADDQLEVWCLFGHFQSKMVILAQKIIFFGTPRNSLFSFNIRPLCKPLVLGALPSTVFAHDRLEVWWIFWKFSPYWVYENGNLARKNHFFRNATKFAFLIRH